MVLVTVVASCTATRVEYAQRKSDNVCTGNPLANTRRHSYVELWTDLVQMRGEETRSTRQTTELEYASSFGSGRSGQWGLLEGVLTNGFV